MPANTFGLMAIAVSLSASPVSGISTVPASGPSGCRGIDLQGRTVEAIQGIEKRWLESEIRGDPTFLDCLLDQDYSVILAQKNKVITKAELLQRVTSAKTNSARAIPLLQTKVSLSGDTATAYSWIEDAQGKVSASYVDFYRYEGGMWRAVAGVDL